MYSINPNRQEDFTEGALLTFGDVQAQLRSVKCRLRALELAYDTTLMVLQARLALLEGRAQPRVAASLPDEAPDAPRSSQS